MRSTDIGGATAVSRDFADITAVMNFESAKIEASMCPTETSRTFTISGADRTKNVVVAGRQVVGPLPDPEQVAGPPPDPEQVVGPPVPAHGIGLPSDPEWHRWMPFRHRACYRNPSHVEQPAGRRET